MPFLPALLESVWGRFARRAPDSGHLSRQTARRNRLALACGQGTIPPMERATRTPAGTVRRRGFTLLEIAMVLVTLAALVAVALGASSSEGFRGASRSASATATQEALVTVLSRAAADAIEQRGVYRPAALIQGASGLQVEGVALQFDCTRGGQPQPGQVTECPSITVGSEAQAASGLGSEQAGQLVAHLNDAQTRAIVVSMTANGRCAVVVGEVEEIVARYLTDAAGGACRIPAEHID